ncbi:MAG: hypothetical protein K9G46_15885 [Flavobacteriales bacterium]|nr:hypothetical protein [Flavobacteriales bacterium]
MKKAILLFFLCLPSIQLLAQNGVMINYGLGGKDDSAILELKSADQGFLAPKIALTSTTATAPIYNNAPAVGLIVYNTATVSDVIPGYYYWDDAKWTRLLNGASGSSFIENLTVGNVFGTGQAASYDITGNAEIGGTLEVADNVGINTTTPGAKLDIAGGADNDGANDLYDIALQYRTGGYRHFVRSRHNSTITTAGNDIDFYLNNSTTTAGSSAPGIGNIQVLTLESFNSTPRVGIGTTVPGATLHVSTLGTATSTAAQFLTPSLAASAATYLKLGKAISAGDQADIIFNWAGANSPSNYLGFGFHTRPLYMAINADGNVSIGQNFANASGLLEVKKTAQLHANLVLSGQEYYTSTLPAANTGVALVNGVNRSGNKQLWIMDQDKVATQNTTNAVIRLMPNASQGVIDAIATNGLTPLPLVVGSSGASVNVPSLNTNSAVYTDGSRNLTSTGPNNGNIGFWTRDNTNSYLYSTTLADKVGIGTASPLSKLMVFSGINSTLTTAQVGTSNAVFDGGSGTANSRVVIGSNWTGTGTRPESQLEFWNNAFGGGESNSATIATVSSQGSAAGRVNGSLIFSTANNATSTSEQMRIASNGNVGIGNSAPGSKLHIGSTKQFNVWIDQSNVAEYRFYYLGKFNNNNGDVTVNGILGGHTNSQGKAKIDVKFSSRDGFLAVGQVDGEIGTGADIVVYETGGQQNVYLKTYTYALVNLDVTASSGATIGYDGTYSTSTPSGTLTFTLGTGIGGITRTNNAGNVGIGITTPTEKLHVVGNTRVSSLAGTGSRPVYADANGVLQTNATISQVDALYIRGTSYSDSDLRILRIGTTEVYNQNGTIGLRLTIINKSNHAVVSTNTYNTYSSAGDANNLATALNNMTDAQLGVLTSFDAWTTNVTTTLVDAFKKKGLYKAALLGGNGSYHRTPYAAIFESSNSAGLPTASASEVAQNLNGGTNQPYAEIRGWLMDGMFVATTQVPSGLSTPSGSYAVGVDPSGNVGIGTSSPSATLDVEGEIRHNAVYKLNDNAETTLEWETMEYIIEAGPSVVGRVKPMNMTLVNQLCKDKNGCNVTIQMVNWDASGQPGNVASREERLFISETSNAWRFSNNDVWGIDNNGGANEWTPWDCFFTDAETTGAGNARSDNAVGFGLLNVSGGSYSDATTTCRIVIRD